MNSQASWRSLDFQMTWARVISHITSDAKYAFIQNMEKGCTGSRNIMESICRNPSVASHIMWSFHVSQLVSKLLLRVYYVTSAMLSIRDAKKGNNSFYLQEAPSNGGNSLLATMYKQTNNSLCLSVSFSMSFSVHAHTYVCIDIYAVCVIYIYTHTCICTYMYAHMYRLKKKGEKWWTLFPEKFSRYQDFFFGLFLFFGKRGIFFWGEQH